MNAAIVQIARKMLALAARQQKFRIGDAQGLDHPGQRFTRSYAEAGTFDYVCSVHPYMTGKVTVRP